MPSPAVTGAATKGLYAEAKIKKFGALAQGFGAVKQSGEGDAQRYAPQNLRFGGGGGGGG